MINDEQVSSGELKQMLLTKLIEKGLDLETATSRVDGYLEAAAGEDAINKKILEAIGHLLSTEESKITVSQAKSEVKVTDKPKEVLTGEREAKQKPSTLAAEAKEDGKVNKEIIN